MSGEDKKQEITFEQSLEALEDIVARMEQKDTGLDQALALFEKGLELSRKCHSHLNRAAGKVEKLVKDLEGNAGTIDYDFKEDRREL
jgi:exodeoxyribonuclease VII small subunit